MVNYHQWVTRQHAGTRESHHFPDLFPHFWFVTMNLTITAKRLGLHKWTAVRAKMSIGEKSFALRTEPAFQGMVFFSAVQRNHKGNDLFFPFPFISSHERMFDSRILLSYSPDFCEKICVFKKNQKDDQNTEW